MPNSLSQQTRQVALWNNRPVITLNENDGDAHYFHGVMIGPAGMEYPEAMRKLDAAFNAAVAANPDEWNYDEVIAEMEKVGFESVLAAEWFEQHA